MIKIICQENKRNQQITNILLLSKNTLIWIKHYSSPILCIYLKKSNYINIITTTARANFEFLDFSGIRNFSSTGKNLFQASHIDLQKRQLIQNQIFPLKEKSTATVKIFPFFFLIPWLYPTFPDQSGKGLFNPDFPSL